MRGALGLAGRRMHGQAFGMLKSIRHSLGLRDEDQPIRGAGGAIPISMTAILKSDDEDEVERDEAGEVGDRGINAFVAGEIGEFALVFGDRGPLLQKSRTQGEVFTRSA